MHDLGTLGGSTSIATAINEAGQIIGTAATPSGQMHAFLYDGTMHDLCVGGTPQGINHWGQVVGGSIGGSAHAYMYDGELDRPSRRGHPGPPSKRWGSRFGRSRPRTLHGGSRRSRRSHRDPRCAPRPRSGGGGSRASRPTALSRPSPLGPRLPTGRQTICGGSLYTSRATGWPRYISWQR